MHAAACSTAIFVATQCFIMPYSYNTCIIIIPRVTEERIGRYSTFHHKSFWSSPDTETVVRIPRTAKLTTITLTVIERIHTM